MSFLPQSIGSNLYWQILVACLSLSLTLPAGARELPSRLSVQTSIGQSVSLTQSDDTPIKVTAIRVRPQANGIELILTTPTGNIAVPNPQTQDNLLYFDLPNALLSLENAREFRAATPTANIAEVTVTQHTPTSIRVSVRGIDRPPAASLAFNNPPPTPVAQNPSEPELEVTVTGLQNRRGYRLPSGSTATKTETPLQDIPQAIQILPAQVLKDRNVIRTGEALQNVSGVINQEGGYSGYEDLIFIRGFQASTFNGNFYRDGIPYYTIGFTETTNIDRIEVLKGPASVLFGQGQPGGIINFVSKQPLDRPYHQADLTIGSFNNYRATIDATGPLREDKTLKYRINASYENSRSFRDFVKVDRLFIAPVLTWDFSPNTSLRVDAEYTRNNSTMDDGIPASGRSIANVPISRFLSEPFSNFRKDEYSLGYLLSHKFNDNWSGRHNFRYQSISPERYYPYSVGFDPATGILERGAYFANGNYQQLFANAEVVGKFATGSVPHQLLVGVEYRKNNETPGFDFSTPYPSIDIFNPIYIDRPYPKVANFFRDDNYTTLGVYVQDQIDVLPNVKLLVGARYDNFQQSRSTQELNQPRQDFSQADSALTPRLGVVYQPTRDLSLYTSYTRSFVPSFGTSRNGDDSPFKPENGTQLEVGVKANLSNKLSLTVAAFDLKKQNVVTADPNNLLFSIQTGEQTSQGIEIDLAGEILPGWKAIVSYANTNAFISADNTLTVGSRLDNIPRNQASLWTRYDFPDGDLKGLGIGLGLYYIGDRTGDLNDTFTLPSYLRTDAAIFYKRDNWKAQLNFRNLFNTQYVSSSSFGSNLSINPGAPFSVSANFGIEF